jgi:seryl-tRNA synthetase
MRLTLEEYSKHFKMSKEMIHSKLKNKKLNYIIENGTTYIIVPRSSLNSDKHQKIQQEQKEQQMQKQDTSSVERTITKPKTTVAMVIALYQKENQQLKEKIAYLEAKIDKLIDDKEQMLRDEMSKIEQVYAKKDEQLKNILELMNTQLIAQKQQATEHDVEPIEAQSIPKEEEKKEDEIVELKTYLKTLDLEPYQRKIIKKRFLAVYDKDVRIIKQNGKLYLNFSKYDYSDLLEY